MEKNKPYNLGNYRYNKFKSPTSLKDIGMDGSMFHVKQNTPTERANYDDAKHQYFTLDAAYIIGDLEEGMPCNTSEKLQLYKLPGGKVKFADMLIEVLDNMRGPQTVDIFIDQINNFNDVGRKYVTELMGFDDIPNIHEHIDTLLKIMKETNTTTGMKSDLKDIYRKDGGIELLDRRLGGLHREEIIDIMESEYESSIECAVRETLEETGYFLKPYSLPIAEVYEYKDIHGTIVVKAAELFYATKGEKHQDPILSPSEKDQGLVANLLTPDKFHQGIRQGLERKLGLQKYKWKGSKRQTKKISGQIRNLLFIEAYKMAKQAGRLDLLKQAS